MLSRTADHLFWMARYMERAENTARMLDVNYQTSLLPQSAEAAEQGWRGLLSISELRFDYARRYGAIDPRAVLEFMVRDERNPSSIASCLRAARENARAVRGTLTTEVWETTNQTWLEFPRISSSATLRKDPGAVFEWVKFRSHLSRGVAVGTMLQDEAFHFVRIGSFLERADNTARLLDVKFHSADGEYHGALQRRERAGRAPEAPARDAGAMTQSTGGGAMRQTLGGMSQALGPGAARRVAAPGGSTAPTLEQDFYHWSSILRTVSAFEVYRKVYRNVIQPEKVAELLILRADMPRSLAACVNEVVANLRLVANEQSVDTLRRAGRLQSELQYGRIDEILATGLHAYLTQFLDRVGDLGAGISRDFLVAVH